VSKLVRIVVPILLTVISYISIYALISVAALGVPTHLLVTATLLLLLTLACTIYVFIVESRHLKVLEALIKKPT